MSSPRAEQLRRRNSASVGVLAPAVQRIWSTICRAALRCSSVALSSGSSPITSRSARSWTRHSQALRSTTSSGVTVTCSENANEPSSASSTESKEPPDGQRRPVSAAAPQAAEGVGSEGADRGRLQRGGLTELDVERVGCEFSDLSEGHREGGRAQL